MKTTSNFLFALIAVLISTSFKAQDIKPVLENEKQIVYKVSSYSPDVDKMVRKEFAKDKTFKIVYTCLQTGLVVFESKEKINSSQKEEIQNRLTKVNEAIQFLHMQGFGIKEAEEKCDKTKSVN